MSFIDTIKGLFGGASDHAQNLQDTVQNIGDSEVAQQLKDGATDLGAQAQDAATGATDAAKEAAENVKNTLTK